MVNGRYGGPNISKLLLSSVLTLYNFELFDFSTIR